MCSLAPHFPYLEMYRLMTIEPTSEQRKAMIAWLRAQGLKHITLTLVDAMITIEIRLREEQKK